MNDLALFLVFRPVFHKFGTLNVYFDLLILIRRFNNLIINDL